MDMTAIPRYLLASMPEQCRQHSTDLLVIGGGAAGLAAALHAAEQARVILLSRDALPTSNSAWAQGGIAAALDRADSPARHVEDTLIAGAGLSDPEAVAILTHTAPGLMYELLDLGMPFERDAQALALGLEGGHSHRRVLHVGDATGQALTRTLIARVLAHPRIQVWEGYQAVDLVGNTEQCRGVLALDSHGIWHAIAASATILATGGAGALYGLTSNQAGALGDGIALAYRAGAEVADMEFVQFHPTVLRTKSGQGFLISEAVRGEGARLLTAHGYRFMPDYDPRGELAPRDIVTRGIGAAMQRAGSDHVLLDLTHLPSDYLQRRFPTIMARCRAEGYDPAVEPVPVAPAAHYLMGGIRTDLWGASSWPGLYAAGECACTGVHGANRLASNSLLECLVFGRRAAQAALRERHTLNAPRPLALRQEALRTGQLLASRRTPSPRPDTQWRARLARIMGSAAGPLRQADGLNHALDRLAALPVTAATPEPDALTAANAALVARLIVTSALARTESRGAHFRQDFPHTSEDWHGHLVMSRERPPYLVETVAAPALELVAA